MSNEVSDYLLRSWKCLFMNALLSVHWSLDPSKSYASWTKSYAEKKLSKTFNHTFATIKVKESFSLVCGHCFVMLLFCLYFGVLSVLLNWLFFFIFFKCTERQEEWKMFVALKSFISKTHLLSKQVLHKLCKKLCTKRLSKTFNHTFETMKVTKGFFVS